MKKHTFIQNRKSLMHSVLWFVLFLLHYNNSVFAQCNPDIFAPIILCPASVTVNVAPGICSTTVVLPAPTAVDNCPGGVSITNNAPANNIYPLGPTMVAFTATDLAGNTATCQTKVTVTGGAVYTLVCNDWVTIQPNPSGITTVIPADVLEGGPYNCVDTYISLQSGTPAPFINITGTGMFVVECWVLLPSGGYNKCWGNISIGGGCAPDLTSPTILCPASTTVNVAPGICSTAVVLPAPTAVDNCPGGVSITNNAPANNIYPLGPTVVKFTASDLAGNTTTCQTTVTVTGGASYTLVCNDMVTFQPGLQE